MHQYTAVPVMVVALMVSGLCGSASAQSKPRNQEDRLAALERVVVALQAQVAAQAAQLVTLEADPIFALAPYVVVDLATINGLAGPHVRFHGANVHIQSGAGATDDQGWLTGLGNLVIGYNEVPFEPDGRSGSHNLIVGSRHHYTSSGGMAVGKNNTISAPGASVSGGTGNTASGPYASVSGGQNNKAVGGTNSVSGGTGNLSEGEYTSVCGGLGNRAGSTGSSVTGGEANFAGHRGATVTGGTANGVLGPYGSVTGGQSNTAYDYSTVTGGMNNIADPQGVVVP